MKNEMISTMRDLKDPDNRKAAVYYMRQVLAEGNSLAEVLSQSVNFQLGTISVLSPNPLDPAQTLQFESGHFPQSPVPTLVGGEPGTISPVADSDDQLIELIHQLLETPDAICLLENSVARTGDPWLQHVQSIVVTYGDEVFHVLLGENQTPDKIADAIRDARPVPVFIGAVGRLGSETANLLLRNQNLTPEVLNTLGKTAVLVVVGAYDGEGYLVWRRTA